MYQQTTLTLAVMVLVFAISSWKLKSAEISMVITAIAGALVAGFGFPVRLLVEGTFTYLDLAMIFVTASIFINIYSETGAVNALIISIVDRFYNKKWILFSLMVVIMLIPGALTGAGSVSIFVVGGMVAKIMQFMGISKVRTTGFIYVTAMLAAAAPPINLWAMLMAAQANMPYVGFNVILIVPILIIAAFTVIYFGRGGIPQKKEDILAQIPKPPPGLTNVRIILPLATLLVLFLLSQYTAFSIPVIGLPLMFIICAIVSMLTNPKKTPLTRYYEVVVNTMEQVFSLLATVISVGVLVNIMTGTGVRGLIAITFITLPVVYIYSTVLIFGPFAQGSLSYGSAVILGAPIIFLFNSMGFNVIVVAAALSLIFPLGDCLPPSRIVGRVSIETVGFEGNYMSFLKTIAIPWLFMGGVALLMLIFANKLSFLVVY